MGASAWDALPGVVVPFLRIRQETYSLTLALLSLSELTGFHPLHLVGYTYRYRQRFDESADSLYLSRV